MIMATIPERKSTIISELMMENLRQRWGATV